MATPIYSTQLPSGAINFGFDDGTELPLPPTVSALAMHEQLPDSLEGATAGIDMEAIARDALAGAPQPAPLRTDAAPAGPLSTVDVTASQPSSLEASAANALRMGGSAPTSGRLRPAADRALAAEMTARQYGLSTIPAAAPTAYAPNPNEGAQPPPPPRATPVKTTTIPGAWQPSARQYSYQQTPPEVEEMRTDAIDRRSEADRLRLMEKQAQAEKDFVQGKATDQALAMQEDEAKKLRDRQLEAQKAAVTSIEATQKRIGEMSTNPEQWWDDKSTGQRIGLTIAMALGELGGSLSGRGGSLSGRANGVNALIDQAIERDINSQREKIAQSNKSLEDQKGVYAEMLRLHGNEQDALAATHAAYEGMVARGVKQRAARMNDPEFAALSSEIEAKRNENAAALLAELHTKKVTEAEQYRPPQTIVTGGGAPRGAFNPNDPTAGMSKEDAAQYRKAAGEIAKYAGTLNDLESARDAVATGGGAGTGIVASRAPAVLLSEEGVRVRGKVDNAMIRYGKEVMGSMTAEERSIATDIAKGRGTQQDTLNGLATLSGGVRAVADVEMSKYPAHIQEALRRAHPQLFRTTTPTRAPGK